MAHFFDTTMRSYDGAEVGEMVGLVLLQKRALLICKIKQRPGHS